MRWAVLERIECGYGHTRRVLQRLLRFNAKSQSLTFQHPNQFVALGAAQTMLESYDKVLDVERDVQQKRDDDLPLSGQSSEISESPGEGRCQRWT